MKRQIFNLFTAPFVASILLVPTQVAFGYAITEQTNPNAPEPLAWALDGHNGEDKGLLNQAVEEPATTRGQESLATTASQTTLETQPSAIAKTNAMHNALGSLLFGFLLIGYTLGGLGYRRHRIQRQVALLQRVATLERIWKITPKG